MQLLTTTYNICLSLINLKFAVLWFSIRIYQKDKIFNFVIFCKLLVVIQIFKFQSSQKIYEQILMRNKSTLLKFLKKENFYTYAKTFYFLKNSRINL